MKSSILKTLKPDRLYWLPVSELIIKPKYAKIIPRANEADAKTRFESIKKNGIHDPLFINLSRVVLDGHSRIGDAKKLGIEKVPVIPKKFDNELEEYLFVIEINRARRNLSEGQNAILIVECLDIEEKLAKLRQKSGKPIDESGGRAAEKVAERFDMSPRQVDKVRKIIREGSKELKEQYTSGKLSTNAAYQVVEKETRVVEYKPLPKGTHNVFIIDFPWKYDNEKTGGSMTSGASQKYETMTPDEIVEHYFINPADENNIPKLFAKDCVVFMWMTVPMFRDQMVLFNAMEDFGFKYKHMMFWIKTGTKGLGNWFANQVEVLVMFVKGKVEAFRMPLPNYVLAPVGKHSEKPPQFRNLIEKATVSMGKRKKIELFARSHAKGWVSWGNEAC